jgi:hypothetical protein
LVALFSVLLLGVYGPQWAYALTKPYSNRGAARLGALQSRPRSGAQFESLSRLERLSFNDRDECLFAPPTRGVVAISFWSMVVSFTSGVVGRYFYLQIVMKKVDLQSESQIWQGKLQRYLKNCKIQWSEEEFGPYLVGARTMAGMAATEVGLNPFVAFYKSVLGDWRLRTRNLPMPEKWPAKTQVALRQYALNMRKASTVSSFQRLMGYWHAFHFPFAIFMYVAAAIHVASSLVLGV